MKVEIGNATLYLGDCLEVLRGMPDNSVDSVCCDPPYGLSFMGKKWDYDVPSVEVWAECLRVLKPGGHLLAFAGTRTQHRMAVRIEDAGFEIRDMIAWVYGSGFPKSHDVSKAIDKQAGAERTDALAGGHRGIASDDVQTDGYKAVKDAIGHGVGCGTASRGTPVTDAAQQWQGWGTALKPALEPITVARKPLMGTVADNVLEHGTGALNIDGCRVGVETIKHSQDRQSFQKWKELDGRKPKEVENPLPTFHTGRWPANLIHDGSDEVTGLFPVTTSGGGEKHPKAKSTFMASTEREAYKGTSIGGDTGSAARFFYCAKSSTRDRDEGLEGMPLHDVYSEASATPMRDQREQTQRANIHPTVKPTDLMRYLCRLVTPPGGVVLDCFMGSGSTGKAAMLEGFRFIGIEREAEYLEIAKARIACKAPQEPESAPMQPKPKQGDTGSLF